MDCNELSNFLHGLSGCELVALAGLLSVAISNNLSNDDISILAGFFTSLGDNLALIAASNDSNPSCPC